MFVVTLDAEPFRRERLYFGSARFKRLVELVGSGDVKVVLTDVVVGEIHRAIAASTREALEFLKRRATIQVLGPIAQSASAQLLGSVLKLDPAVIAAEVKAKFDELVALLKAETLSTDEISVKELRDSYFASLPPFGKAEKKHEFPDAMSLLALRAYARKNCTSVHVVSGDKDLEAAVLASTEFQYHATIPDFVNVVLTHVASTRKMADASLVAAEALRDHIAAGVEEEFVETSLYIDEVDGEVEGVEVQDVDITRFYVAKVDGNEVTLEFRATVAFVADVSYNDPDRTAYDEDTGTYTVFGYIDDKVADEVHVSGNVTLHVDANEPGESTIESVVLAFQFYRVNLVQ